MLPNIFWSRTDYISGAYATKMVAISSPDDGDCNGCLDGGGERRLRGLGEGVAGLVGLRPRAEAWGSAVEPGRGGSALEPAEGGALEPEA